MPPEVAPQTYREFRDWFDGMLDSDEMHLTPSAHQIGYATAFEIPMPCLLARPPRRCHDLIMLGSVPARVRGALRDLIQPPPAAGLPGRRVRGLRGTRPFTPRRVREGYNTAHFRMVARTERRRLQRGERTPQVAA